MDLTFGARLRSQREEQHVELAAIAEDTKINIALLEGLERDDLSRWPGGLFRRAYVRTYAQKIGLDPEQVLRDFLAAHPDPVQETCPVEAIAQNAQARRPRTRIGLMIASLAARKSTQKNGTRRLATPSVAEPVVSAPFTPVLEGPVPSAAPPEPEPPAPLLNIEETALPLEFEADGQRIGPRLVMVPTPDSADMRRESRLERYVGMVARLCSRIACARDDHDVSVALDETVRTLEAQGAILWVWDAERDVLYPALAQGYSDELLMKLPEVDRRDDNAIAAAFRCGQRQVVRGTDGTTGAFVAPMMTPDGCAGVLALEFANCGEQHELCQALATMITAQLSTLFAVLPQTSPHATPHALEEDWEQPGRSLVAS
jgi:hypothetical protein